MAHHPLVDDVSILSPSPAPSHDLLPQSHGSRDFKGLPIDSPQNRDIFHVHQSLHQHDPPKRFPIISGHKPSPQAKSRLLKSWVTELLAIILAIFLLIASFVILRAFDGEQTDSWTVFINLNALIAIFSTISRIALASVAAEIISQEKWSWFSVPRPLKDLDVFDQASRGPWGSILLLIRPTTLKKPHLLSTLVVALTSIAMGPFAQQAVQTVPCEDIDLSQEASIPNLRTLGYVPLNGRSAGVKTNEEILKGTQVDPLTDRLYQFMFDGTIQGKMLSSLLEPNANDSESVILPTCPSGDCTFPTLQDTSGVLFTHSSLGLCSKCLDISSLVSYTNIPPADKESDDYDFESWTLPGQYNSRGHELISNFTDYWLSMRQKPNVVAALAFPFLNITIPEKGWQILPDHPTDFDDASRYSLLNVTFLGLDKQAINGSANLGRNAVSATACSLYPCLKSYRASVRGGQLNETLVASEPLKPYGDVFKEYESQYEIMYPSDMAAVRSPCPVDGQVYTTGNMSSTPSAVTLQRVLALKGDTSALMHQELLDGQRSDLIANQRLVNMTAPPECIFAMDRSSSWYTEFQKMLGRVLRGSCWSVVARTLDSGRRTTVCQDGSSKYPDAGSAEAMPAIWLEGLARRPKHSPSEISAYMDSFVESLTRKFRLGQFSVPGRNESRNEWRDTSEAVVGQVRRSTTCFAVDWRWLSLSTVLTALTAVVIVWVIIRGMSRGDVVWKSSVLPFVFYRDQIVVVERVGDVEETEGSWAPEKPMMSIKEMNTESKRVRIVFS